MTDRPPPHVRVIPTDLRREVRKADPEWDKDSRVAVAYVMPNGRIFYEKTDSSGPYADD